MNEMTYNSPRLVALPPEEEELGVMMVASATASTMIKEATKTGINKTIDIQPDLV